MIILLSLSGKWKVKDINNIDDAVVISKGTSENEGWLEATIPGDIHKDLLNLDLIKDPYYSDNLNDCKWVTERNWCFIKVFELEENLINRRNYIEFYGIDTFAEVYLNGSHIGTCNNMFLKYSFKVDGIVKSGKNILCVVIKSIQQEMQKLPHEGYNSCFSIERIFIRKAQCHFSWDWAPNIYATGIWNDVCLKSYVGASVNSIFVRAKDDGLATFFIELNQDGFDYESKYTAQIKVKGIDGNYECSVDMTDIKATGSLIIQDPLLWWPHGLGAQNMYHYEVEILENGEIVDQFAGRFAFREVTYVEPPKTDGEGLSFVIKINNVPVFLKGANWIPLDIMTGTIQDEKYIQAIKLAKNANINCLRAWGGGIYEKEIFYDLCDDNGILIWHEFMFACAELPTEYPGFIESLVPEFEYQIKRLRNHPSIFLWCGGNEKPGGLVKCECKGKEMFQFLFRGIANHFDGTRPYFENCPWSYEVFGNSQLSGDVHMSAYNESLYAKDISGFRNILSSMKSGMATEIACMGCSPYSSIIKFIPQEKLWPVDNDIWNLHLRNNPYDSTGDTFVAQQIRVAEELFGEITDTCDFIKKSMVSQAEFIKAEIEYHRSRRNDCAGALLWMYSDIWPCGTWSIVDYYLTPKAGYYSMARACQNVLPVIVQNEKGIHAYVVNDTMNEIKGNIVIGQMCLDGRVIRELKIENVSCKEAGSRFIATFNKFDVNIQDSYLFISFSSNNKVIRNTFFPKLWYNFTFKSVIIDIEDFSQKHLINNYITDVVLSTDYYTRTVNLNLKDKKAEFSDNYFDLEPFEKKHIQIITEEPFEPSALHITNWLDKWDYVETVENDKYPKVTAVLTTPNSNNMNVIAKERR